MYDRLRPRIPALLALTAAGALAQPAAAATERVVPSYTAVRTSTAPLLDGRIDDAAWTAAPAVSGFRQRDPKEGEPASEATELRLAYDDQALYVALRLEDHEARKIVRRLSRRDAAADADLVRIYLDPNHDHRSGAYFEVSAAGVQGDAVIYNDSWDDRSWDAVWESAVSVDERGWSAELKIPFSQLRFPVSERQVWGLNAVRVIRRKNEEDWLELVPKNENGLASRMAHVEGLTGIQPRRHLALVPYALGRSEFVAPDGRDPFNDGSRQLGALGLDLKYGLTSNLTLDATFTPDFGQVEVDPAVVNRSDSETFFDEKRPFFIEGSELLGNFGRDGSNNFWGFNRAEPQLYYSRRIGRRPQADSDADFVARPSGTTILGALKLSGKTQSGWSLGLLDALTAAETARLSDGRLTTRQPIEPRTNYTVARATRTLARGGIGTLVTAVDRSQEGALADLLVGKAYVAGIDGHYFLDAKKDWVVVGGLAASRISGTAASLEEVQTNPQHYFQRPDSAHVELDRSRTALSGWTGNVNLNRQSGRFRVNAALWATSPGFESNDLGFNWKSDRWGGHLVGEWKKTEPDKRVRSASLAVAKWYSLNFSGDRQGDGAHVFLNTTLNNYWSVGGNVFGRRQAWDDQRTRGGPAMLQPASHGGGFFVQSDSRKRVSAGFETFFSQRGIAGSDAQVTASLEVKPFSSLTVSVGPQWTRVRSAAQWVDSFDDRTALATFGARYVFADLRQTELAMATRFNWILTPRLSVQVYAQPLVSAGAYAGFKELARPRSYAFTRYGSEAGTISYDPAAESYTVDPDGAGPAVAFSFDRPDFNFKSLRINAVVRWEYRPGSTLFVAWTQQREDDLDPGDMQFGRDLGRLLRAPGDDILLVKLSWRFGR
jgi:hypothetical protein